MNLLGILDQMNLGNWTSGFTSIGKLGHIANTAKWYSNVYNALWIT